MRRLLTLLALLLLPYAALAQAPPTGALVEATVTCGTGSTTLLAAQSASKFIMIQVPPTGGTVWVNAAGAAAVAAPPSIALVAGNALSWSPAFGFVPATAMTCIAPVAQAVTIVYW